MSEGIIKVIKKWLAKRERRSRLLSYLRQIKYIEGVCTSCEYRDDSSKEDIFYYHWLSRHRTNGIVISGPICIDCSLAALKIQNKHHKNRELDKKREEQEKQRLKDDRHSKIIESAVLSAMRTFYQRPNNDES